jgi:hypothetical protein
LKAASRCESPAAEWPARIATLVAADEYGAREELLRSANLLLGEDALRALVAAYEAQVDDALVRATPQSERINWPASAASAALSLLSEALRDPDVLVRATLKRNPSPHPVQKESLVRAFLRYDRPEGALPWLEASWDHLESSRQRLHAEVLTAIGRSGEAAVIRRRIFEGTLSVSDFHDWLELLPPTAQPEAVEQARALATKHGDPVVVASLLLDLGDGAAAEAALVAAPCSIRGGDYGTLLPLAQALESERLWTGATAVSRAAGGDPRQGVLGCIRSRRQVLGEAGGARAAVQRAHAARTTRDVRGQDSVAAQAQVKLLGACQSRARRGCRRSGSTSRANGQARRATGKSVALLRLAALRGSMPPARHTMPRCVSRRRHESRPTIFREIRSPVDPEWTPGARKPNGL